MKIFDTINLKRKLTKCLLIFKAFPWVKDKSLTLCIMCRKEFLVQVEGDLNQFLPEDCSSLTFVKPFCEILAIKQMHHGIFTRRFLCRAHTTCPETKVQSMSFRSVIFQFKCPLQLFPCSVVFSCFLLLLTKSNYLRSYNKAYPWAGVLGRDKSDLKASSNHSNSLCWNSLTSCTNWKLIYACCDTITI